MLSQIISRFIEIVLPQFCLICRERCPHIACKDCLKAVFPNDHNRCVCCASITSLNTLCGQCLQKPPAFDQAFFCYPYNQIAKQWIHAFKYHRKLYYARLFAAQLFDVVQHLDIDAIVAVPLHRKRLLQRGYNQSHEIAKLLAKKMEKPLIKHAVVRIKHTMPQYGLKKKARQMNLQGAFRLKKAIPHQKILVIDDVMTTGSTVKALSKPLKKAKKQIFIAAIFRA